MGKLIDLTGQRFGSLVVLGKGETIHYPKGTVVKWVCKCDCGVIKEIQGSMLRYGRAKTCGHPIDYTGQRFGRLVALERVTNRFDSKGNKCVQWKCQCDCGNITYVKTGTLGVHTNSCGCYQREISSMNNRKHGYSNTRLKRIYTNIKQRCNNKNNTSYSNYGGRGIKVCDEWNKPDGLKNFAEWALSNGYRDDLTIERKDVNGNYEPDNCTWIPLSEQGRNKRTNVYIEYNDEKMLLVDFAKKIGSTKGAVSTALKRGKTIEEIAERYGK